MSDNSTPATKEDIRMLMEQIGSYFDRTESRLGDLRDEMEGSKEEIIRHFDVRVEDIRHDLLGANKDKLENHEDRLVRLERHAGLRAA